MTLLQGHKVCIPAKKLETFPRRFIGSMLRADPTRFDLRFGICQLASSLPSVLASQDGLKLFITMANKLHARASSHHSPLSYFALPNLPDHNRFPHPFAFSDASFATLRETSSVESCYILYAIPLDRDGTIRCAGNTVAFHCRKMMRIARSTAQSEDTALCNAGGLCLYCQIVHTEVLTGSYEIRFLQDVSSLPLLSPFKTDPSSSSSVLEELARPALIDLPAQKLSSQTSLSSSTLIVRCLSCSESSSMSIPLISTDYLSVPSTTGSNIHRPALHALLLLPDCSNVVSAVLQGNPRTRERTNRLLAAHLRDLHRFLNLSFANAALNISDLGTKRNGNIHLYRQLRMTGIPTSDSLSVENVKELFSLRPHQTQ